MYICIYIYIYIYIYVHISRFLKLFETLLTYRIDHRKKVFLYNMPRAKARVSFMQKITNYFLPDTVFNNFNIFDKEIQKLIKHN